MEPLSSGLLSGNKKVQFLLVLTLRYQDTTGSKITLILPRKVAKVRQFASLAKDLGCTTAQLALA